MTITNTDVLVVGAGPIGLSTSIFLKSQGFQKFRVIDKASEPDESLIKGISRAIGIHARTLEILEDVGVTPELIARGKIAYTASNYYNSKLKYRVDYPSGCDHSHVRYNVNLMCTQGNTIDILHQHLTKTLSHSVSWNTDLVELTQNDKGVTAKIFNRNTGETELVTAKYVVGADGCHSVVRKALGVAFPGEAYPVKWVVCDLDIEWDIPHDDITFLGVKNKYAIALPLAGGDKNRFRVTMGMPLSETELSQKNAHAAPMDSKVFSSEDCIDFFKSIYPSAKIKSTPEKPQKWFQVHCRLADTFSVGRCFLVGDAGHVHSPILGQGMNMGIQDANNLAWKLVSVCRGDSEEKLLDTYSQEREYSDREIVKFVHKVTKLVITPNMAIQNLRGFILSRILKVRSGRRGLVSKVMQLSVNYSGSESPLVKENWSKKKVGVSTGSRIPDPEYITDHGNSRRLFETIKGNRWNALVFLGKNPSKKDYDRACEVANKIHCDYKGIVAPHLVVADDTSWSKVDPVSKIDDRKGVLHQAFGTHNASIYLCRPDRYVGYRENGFDNCLNYLESIYPTYLATGDIAYGYAVQ